jgi:hypothetical protein
MGNEVDDDNVGNEKRKHQRNGRQKKIRTYDGEEENLVTDIMAAKRKLIYL